jgi:hypothetical protein
MRIEVDLLAQHGIIKNTLDVFALVAEGAELRTVVAQSYSINAYA